MEHDVKEVVEVPAEIITSPVYVPGAVKVAKTAKYKLDDGSVVLPIEYEYKPMTDYERMKVADRMRRAQKVDEMREVSYHALSQHVLRIEIPDFDPTKSSSWKAITCGEVIEEMLGVIRGDGRRVGEEEIKN